jgi:hypothetical protein
MKNLNKRSRTKWITACPINWIHLTTKSSGKVKRSDSAPFVEFMLEAIREIIENIGSDQVKRLLRFMNEAFMSAAEMMAGLSLSHRPTFRKNSLPPLSSCWFLLIQVKNQHPLQNQCKAGRNSNAGTCPQPKRGFRPANKCSYQNVQEYEKCTGGRNRLLMDKPYE